MFDLKLIIFWINVVPCVFGIPLYRDNIDNEVLKPKYSQLESLEEAELEVGFYKTLSEDDDDSTYIPKRHGHSNESSSCTEIRHMPPDLQDSGIYHFYKKYTEAYGIPVMASEHVSDRALMRACYVVRFMFADNADIRNAFFAAFGRVAILAEGEKITALPEYAELLPKNYESLRALGGARTVPVVVVGEEMLDCQVPEDFLIRELAIGIVNIALPNLPAWKDFLRHLLAHYHWVMYNGRWEDTSASLSPLTYLGEGFQSYFNANKYENPPDGLNNDIASRNSLASYDPRLFNLILELKSCGNDYLQTCKGNEDGQLLRMNCPVQRWPLP